MSKTWLYALGAIIALILVVVIRMTFPFEIAAIKVAAEPLPGLVIPIPGAPIPITNSLLATWLVMALLVLFSLWVRSSLQTIPSGKQNVAEMAVEALYGLTENVAGPKWAPTFFPIVATIFLFVLLSNLLDPLAPLLAAVGIKEIVNGKEEIIPILRSPSTDLNFTVGLALVSVALTQYFGVRANGFFGYLGKFINIGGFVRFVQAVTGRRKGNPAGILFLGLIDFVMGIIELISEVAKILSFSFRLFGNIFAGEVLLLVIPFLLSFIVPLPFLGLELFVGFIQAFVFAVLTLAFMSTATVSHSGDEHQAH
ncbi:MAG: F0F1 ATP synthase subunit A [Chloroflexi bacterium]|nr:F0F1 ATP synthase subunit A [Chloroflexota bacterium]